MLSFTKYHKDYINGIPSVKFGKTVPEDAVNLVYFYNKRLKPFENLFIIDAPKDTIDHLDINSTKHYYNLTSMDESVFPRTINYTSETGYTSTLNLSNIIWALKVKEDTEERLLKYETVIGYRGEMPPVKEYDDDIFKGTLSMVDINLVPNETVQINKLGEEEKTIGKKVQKELTDNTSPSSAFSISMAVDENSFKGNINISGVETEAKYKDNLWSDYISKFKTFGDISAIENYYNYSYKGKTYKFPIFNKVVTDTSRILKELIFDNASYVPGTINYYIDGLYSRGYLKSIIPIASGETNVNNYYGTSSEVPSKVIYTVAGKPTECNLIEVKSLAKTQWDYDNYYDIAAAVPSTSNKVIDGIPMKGTLKNTSNLNKQSDGKGYGVFYKTKEEVPATTVIPSDNGKNLEGKLKTAEYINKRVEVNLKYVSREAVLKKILNVVEDMIVEGPLVETKEYITSNIKGTDYYNTKEEVPQTITKLIDGLMLTGTLVSVEEASEDSSSYDMGISQYWSTNKNGSGYGGLSGLQTWSDSFPVLMNTKYSHYIDDEGALKSSGWEYAPEIAKLYSKKDASNNQGMLWLDDYDVASKGWPPKEHTAHEYFPELDYLANTPGFTKVSGEGPAGIYYYASGKTLYSGGPKNYYTKPVICFYKKPGTSSKYCGVYKFTYYTGVYDFKAWYGIYELNKYCGEYDYSAYYGVYDYATFCGEYIFYKYECEYKGKLPVDEPIESYKGYALYKGLVKRYGVIGKDIRVKNYKATGIYKGVVSRKDSVYDGTAYYEGLAVKKDTPGNITAEFNSMFIMYPDDNGILKDENGINIINSESFDITDIFKDGTPLFYSYRLSKNIYSKDNLSKDESKLKNMVKIVNSKGKEINQNKYKYVLKASATQNKDVYSISIYTNFKTSLTNTLYCVYNAYDTIDETVIAAHKELIKPSSFLIKDQDFIISPLNADKKTSSIQVLNPNIIEDTRNKINFSYRVATTDGTYVSNVINSYCVNYNYALEHEKKYFKDYSFCVSTNNDILDSAVDIIIRDCSDKFLINGKFDSLKLDELKKKTFKVTINGSDYKNKVFVYTNPDGSSPIYAETTENTGFLNEADGSFTALKSLPSKYKVLNNTIYPAYAVRCKDIKDIMVQYPKETNTLENWYPRVKAGKIIKEIEEYGVTKTYYYFIKEFDKEPFSNVYKKPYIDIIDEIAIIIDEETIKVSNAPMLVESDGNTFKNLTVKKASIIDNSYKLIHVSYAIEKDGIIKLSEKINTTDTIKVSYTYEEENYTYRGYYDKFLNFIDIDLNPIKYHTYLDNRVLPFERKPVYTLMNEAVHLFLKPAIVTETKKIGETYEETVLETNSSTLYHKIGSSTPDSEQDLSIGKIYVRHNSSSNNISMFDTRVRGGGIKKSLNDNLRRELEMESDYYFDIGSYDGDTFNENNVIIIRLDKAILKENGGNFSKEEVNKVINRWIALGSLPIIEYV